MNLKSCATKQKNLKHYTPHKLRSHPLRWITFPICVVFLFILFWPIICPLIFVFLPREHNNWPHQWPYYYWTVALIVFVILLSILVCLWRCVKGGDLSRLESDSLLNSSSSRSKTSKQKDLYMISLSTIQRSQDKLETAPVLNVKKIQNYTDSVVPILEETLTGNDPKSESKADTVFRRCSIASKPEKGPNRPDNLAIPTVRETKVEVHSASSPLTPRELFFWDLIQNANQSRSSVIDNFIGQEKESCSLDNASLNCTKPSYEGTQMRVPRNEKLSSAEYFIANVPDRKSLTAEVFLYVDGDQQEKCLKIRTSGDVNDNVFKN